MNIRGFCYASHAGQIDIPIILPKRLFPFQVCNWASAFKLSSATNADGDSLPINPRLESEYAHHKRPGGVASAVDKRYWANPAVQVKACRHLAGGHSRHR